MTAYRQGALVWFQIANGMVRRRDAVSVGGKSSETHHRESVHLIPSAPPVGIAGSRTVLDDKGSRSRARKRRALVSCAPFCKPSNCDGRLRREADALRSSSGE